MLKLDKKDMKILSELDNNSRQPISSIAKKARLSKEVVNYRIRNLEKKGIVENYYTILDIAKLGFMYIRIYLKFQNISPQTEENLIDDLLNHPNIGWITRDGGEYDLCLSVWARTITEFEKISDELNLKYGKYFLVKHFSIGTKMYHFRHNYLHGGQDFSAKILRGEIQTFSLDNKDLAILGLLAKNARASNLDIAKKVKMSPNAVKYRIKNLIQENVIIGFTAKFDIRKLGYQHIKTFFTLYDVTPAKYSELITYLRYHPNVIYTTKAIGIYELECEFIVKTEYEYEEMMRKIRYKFADIIKNYKSMGIFKEYRINYLPMYKKF